MYRSLRLPKITPITSLEAFTPSQLVESGFNGRLRDELLNEMLFSSLAHARAVLAEWQLDYNTDRPHGSVDDLPPAHFAKLSASAPQRDRSLRAIGGYAPRPVAAPSRSGSNDPTDSTHPRMRNRAQVTGRDESFR